MARKPSPTLTEAELRLMQVLWTKQTATVGEVVEALKNAPLLAYTTVLTMLRILERKGYVRHQTRGRAFVYQAVVHRNEASHKAVKHLLNRFFNNSLELLVLNILENEKINSGELKRLKKMIEENESEDSK